MSLATNRRQFLWSTLIGSALPATLHAADTPVAPAPAPDTPLPPSAPVPGIPYVTAPTADGVTIVWSVDAPCTGWVEYGETPELGKIAHGAEDGLRPYSDRVITIPLKGLTPGAKIYYRTVTAPISFPNHYKITRGDAIASPAFDFIFPGSTASAKIMMWSDTHQQKDTLASLAKFTNDFTPDLLVWNGDIVADQFNQEHEFSDSFLPRYKDYAPAANRVLLFSRGNHDARGTLARELPNYAPRVRADGYHNLTRIGPVAVLTLDTGDDKEGPNIYGDLGEFAAYREAQRVWLESATNDPRFASAPFRIVFCHIPLRWKIPGDIQARCVDGDARWSALLSKARVNAVISGHVHEHWHAAPADGYSYHQITGGGPRPASTLDTTKLEEKRTLEASLANSVKRDEKVLGGISKINGWSPTPAAPVLIEASTSMMRIRVVEAVSRRELLNLEFKA